MRKTLVLLICESNIIFFFVSVSVHLFMCYASKLPMIINLYPAFRNASMFRICLYVNLYKKHFNENLFMVQKFNFQQKITP